MGVGRVGRRGEVSWRVVVDRLKCENIILSVKDRGKEFVM